MLKVLIFVLIHLWALVATVADIETTARSLARGAVEENPLYGKHPSRSLMYGSQIPAWLAITLFDGYLMTHYVDPVWWVIAVLLAFLHSWMAALNWNRNLR